MSIEDVVRRLESDTHNECVPAGQRIDIRAMLDAYREAKAGAQAALKLANDRALADTRELMTELEAARAEVARIKKYGDHTNASCSMLGARCVELEKEVKHLKGYSELQSETMKSYCADLLRGMAERDTLKEENEQLQQRLQNESSLISWATAEAERQKVVRLSEENARLKQENLTFRMLWGSVDLALTVGEGGNLTNDEVFERIRQGVRAQELLASARAQGEAHLQARLRAQDEMLRLMLRVKKSTPRNNFRRLAKRYLGLRSKTKNARFASNFWLNKTEAAEQRVKELEEMAETNAIKLAKEDIERLSEPVGVMGVLRLYNHFSEQSKQGLNTTDWYQHYLDACAAGAEAELKAAELQKCMDEKNAIATKAEDYRQCWEAAENKAKHYEWLSGEMKTGRDLAESKVKELEADHSESEKSLIDSNVELQKRVDELEPQYLRLHEMCMASGKSDIRDEILWLESQLAHAESVAMGSAFELGRALHLLARRAYKLGFASSDEIRFLFMFDAPGGGR